MQSWVSCHVLSKVVNSSKHAYSPPSRQPYWLSLEEINQCRLCLRFHGISGFVMPWAHQDGLIEGDCLTQSRLGSSRAGHYIYDPVECWNGYYPLQYFPQDFFCDTGMAFFFFSHSTSSLPLSFPYMGVNLWFLSLSFQDTKRSEPICRRRLHETEMRVGASGA